MPFQTLVADERFLYRGVNGAVEREIFSTVGLGPIYWTARRAVRENIALSNGALAYLTRRLVAYGSVVDPAYLPQRPRFESVFNAVAETAVNHLTANDHVFFEEPVQKPAAGRAVDSLTGDPKISILYGYGIHPDRVGQLAPNVVRAFYRDAPNNNASVAVVAREDTPVIAGQAGPPVAVAGASEVARRMMRDREHLLPALVAVHQVVPLPAFNVATPQASLDAAAVALVAAGVAR